MFRSEVDICGSFRPHKPHEWREGFLWLWVKHCKGIEKKHVTSWQKANPSLVGRVDAFGVKAVLPHKCFYKLTTIIWLPGDTIYRAKPNNVYWQCECGEYYCMSRAEVRDMLRSKKDYNQTWPS